MKEILSTVPSFNIFEDGKIIIVFIVDTENQLMSLIKSEDGSTKQRQKNMRGG